MKWFQVDADTPRDPSMRRVIRTFGNAGLGGLVQIWCFVAGHGAQPGRAVDSNNRPYSDDDLADAANMSLDEYAKLRDFCLEIGHFDKEAWEGRSEVFIPAQAKRADEATKKRMRKTGNDSGGGQLDFRNDSGTTPATRQDSTEQHTTKQDSTLHDVSVPALVLAWNKTVAGSPLKPVDPTLITKKMDAHIRARLKQMPLGQWELVFARMVKSDFLCGRAKNSDWVASFSWLIKSDDNAVKVLNGNYDNSSAPKKAAAAPVAGKTGAAPSGKYAHLTEARQ